MSLKPAVEVNYRRDAMQIITEYTRHEYRAINRDLLNGIVNEQAAALIEAVASLPPSPGTTYRTFWMDDIGEYVTRIKTARPLIFAAFTSTSRIPAVAAKFQGNVKMTIEGKTGRDIASYSDAPNEAETLYLPGLVVAVKKLKTLKVAGQVMAIEVTVQEQ